MNLSSLHCRNAEHLNNDLSYEAGLGKYLRSGGYVPTLAHQRARQIMGRNVFGVEEIWEHFGLVPWGGNLPALMGMPFTERVLESCRNTHILVATLPISIDNISKRAGIKLRAYDVKPGELEMGREQAAWHLVQKTSVADSKYKTLEQQRALLGRFADNPSLQLMVYTIIGHYKATGEILFHRELVRCANRYLGKEGRGAVVGNFDSGGLEVSARRDEECDHTVGLAAVEKM